MFKFAASNVVFAFMKIFKFLQMFPSCNALWRTLENSMPDIIPFVGAFLLFTTGFTFAAHWSFGLRMEEFHSLSRSFSSLMQSVLYGGLPFEEMRRVSPLMAFVFILMWIFVMALVLINMFVAFVTGAQAQLSEEVDNEGNLLNSRCGPSAKMGLAAGVIQYVRTLLWPSDKHHKTIYDA